jgi:hypothetical protein
VEVLVLLAVLICPIVMGGMMLRMRGGSQNRDGGHE